MLYEISLTTVESLERSINRNLRKYLGVPPRFTAVGLYSRTTELQLPISSVVEEFKVSKCRLIGLMTISDSRDSKVREAGIQTGTGRKWFVDSTVLDAESMLVLKDIIGNTCSGRQRLGMAHFQQWSKASEEERRKMEQREVRMSEEEHRKAKAVDLSKQGAWTKWNLPETKVSWTELWRMEPVRISLMLRSVYDALPSLSNLHQWGLAEEPKCTLCGERGTMAHILSGCKTALQQGRYNWGHGRVLQSLGDALEKERVTRRPKEKVQKPSIQFVRHGEKPNRQLRRGKAYWTV